MERRRGGELARWRDGEEVPWTRGAISRPRHATLVQGRQTFWVAAAGGGGASVLAS